MLLKSLRSIFKTELASLIQLQMNTQVCRVLAELPLVLQRHFEFCGYSGNECTRAVTVEWGKTQLRFSTGGKWRTMACEQVNVLTEPVRLVHMRQKLFGLFPFGAIDQYMKGKGRMLIKLLNYFTLTCATGKEMDKAELVTILAETMLIPAYALQHYISWEEVNAQCLKGIITHNGVSASGLFHFGQFGEMLSFETNDRCYTTKNGHYEPTKWIARVANYCERGGYKTPTDFSAVWERPEGHFNYFKGTVTAVTYTPFETYCIGHQQKPVTTLNISPPKLAFP